MARTKIAFITGINGQDGSFLSELLLSKNYEVHGIIRRSSHFNTANIDHIRSNPHFHLHYGDVQDLGGMQAILKKLRDEIVSDRSKYSRRFEIYHLAAQSHVAVSFKVPDYTVNVNACGTLRVLEAVRMIFDEKTDGIEVRIYNATTSEVFGKVVETPQRESTPFAPRSPYACAKAFAHNLCVNYRESYGMFISNGILFNHESERRGENFVTRKITLTINQMLSGECGALQLGNLNARRDWSHARDMVSGMHLILQAEEAKDFVLASDVNHSVREFAELAFKFCGIEIEWTGQGADEKGRDKRGGKILVEVNEKYYRPSEVDTLCGDSSKARCELKWKPKIDFVELVKKMVEHDCREYFIDFVPEKVFKSDSRKQKNVILVTGGSGLVGSAMQKLAERKKEKFIFLNSRMCDLLIESEVARLFEKYQPHTVIHLAALVGGLYKNERDNLMMFQQNQRMNQNVLKYAHKYKVKKLVCCLSTCIYPQQCGQNGRVISETDLHEGLPHESNIGYAMAKRMMSVEMALYNKQFGTNYVCITPTNIFGANDNFHLADSHVIPGLIHKCHLAKEKKEKFVCCGTGRALRQFIYSMDIAKLIILLMEMDNLSERLAETGYNVTLTPPECQEVSIKHVAEKIAQNFNLDLQNIKWDETKSDGILRKTTSNKTLMQLLPQFKFTNFDDALKETVEWFKQNYPKHTRI